MTQRRKKIKYKANPKPLPQSIPVPDPDADKTKAGTAQQFKITPAEQSKPEIPKEPIQNPLNLTKCENKDCQADLFRNIKLSQTRKTQFTAEPKLSPKPTIVDEHYTTVFEIDGTAANLKEYKEEESKVNNSFQLKIKPLYRIIPDTHAHIINYVVVPSSSDILQKLKDGDPVVTKRFLDSQRATAHRMFTKLINMKPENKPTAPTQSQILLGARQTTQTKPQIVTEALKTIKTTNKATETGIIAAGDSTLKIASVLSLPRHDTVSSGKRKRGGTATS